MPEVPTFCRVCEPACGLVALVERGEITSVRPDKEHPVSKGFACQKGIASLDIHRDPDRVDHPQRRTSDGRFEDASWDTAIDAIASKLRTVLEEDGPDAIAVYLGNPGAFNTFSGPATGSFLGQLGVRKVFSSPRATSTSLESWLWVARTCAVSDATAPFWAERAASSPRWVASCSCKPWV